MPLFGIGNGVLAVLPVYSGFLAKVNFVSSFRPCCSAKEATSSDLFSAYIAKFDAVMYLIPVPVRSKIISIVEP